MERLQIVQPLEVRYENMMLAMEDEFFCKTKAEKIVGGEKRLLELIADESIRCKRIGSSQNCKWFCNAADVLRHCKDFREHGNNNEDKSQTA